MVFRRLHLGTVAYGMDSMDEVQSHVFSAYTQVNNTCMQPVHSFRSVKEKEMAENERIHSKHLENKRLKFQNIGKRSNKQTRALFSETYQLVIIVWLNAS